MTPVHKGGVMLFNVTFHVLSGFPELPESSL